MITFQFRAEHKPGWKDEEIKNWEMKLVDMFQEWDFSLAFPILGSFFF